MNAPRFDTLTRNLATGFSRRRLLAGMAAIPATVGLTRRAEAAPMAALPRYDCIPGCCNLGPPGPFGGGFGRCCDDCLDASYRSSNLAGISGSGAIVNDGRVAHFTLFASLLTSLPDQPEGSTLPFAQVRWSDPEAGVALESVGPAYYGPLAGIDGGREVVGMMRAADLEGAYAFILTAVAVAPSGEGVETVSLRVGDAMPEHVAAATPIQPTGFSYTAEGVLMAGDLQLLDVDMSGQVVFPASA